MTDWLAVAVDFGVILAIFLAIFTLGRYLGVDPKLRALPNWAQLVVAGLAMSPFVALNEGWVSVTIVNEELLSFTLLLTLWAVLPVVAYHVLDPEPKPDAGC